MSCTRLLWLQVPLLLWVAAVVVIFAVSQNSLKGLQVRTTSAAAYTSAQLFQRPPEALMVQNAYGCNHKCLQKSHIIELLLVLLFAGAPGVP